MKPDSDAIKSSNSLVAVEAIPEKKNTYFYIFTYLTVGSHVLKLKKKTYADRKIEGRNFCGRIFADFCLKIAYPPN